jgi:hypothetical protein
MMQIEVTDASGSVSRQVFEPWGVGKDAEAQCIKRALEHAAALIAEGRAVFVMPHGLAVGDSP